ncbi:MAG: HD domain-containing protein [Pirellulaceae bacterium]
MRHYLRENLSHDPVHGYIPFTSDKELEQGEVSERQIIDHPWVQRLRFIHQLQTAWWVYPTAEHTRFQHVIGVMHLASRFIGELYPSLKEVCSDCPSRGYVETLLRMAGLLHDVGHGPFGHFFDEHFLRDFGLTHETLGAAIITKELAPLLTRIRRNPNSALDEKEQLDPEQIAWLIQRPKGTEESRPKWLRFLRSLLSGIYTIDNMDFVLRDAFMSGYSQRAYDLERLLHYSFFSEHGLTIHDKGIETLIRFMSVKAELFRTIYFHRTVRAIDLALKDLFLDSKPYLFAGSPLANLGAYLHFTEFSLLVDVQRWTESNDPKQRDLGRRWQELISRQIPWVAVCQRSLIYSEDDSEQASIFSDHRFVEQRLRDLLPAELKSLPLRVDIARTTFRPHTSGPAAGQNFLYDSAQNRIRPLTAHELFRRLPLSHRLCRIYAATNEHAGPISRALDELLGGGGVDDLTNM